MALTGILGILSLIAVPVWILAGIQVVRLVWRQDKGLAVLTASAFISAAINSLIRGLDWLAS